VTIYTDGACQGNPGPGGWAAVLRYGPKYREISGGAPETTNNRMELQAAIEALNTLKQPCEVELWTDSNYLRSGITRWINAWKRRRWRTTEGEPVKNQDLWCALDRAASRHVVHWHWIKGHAGNRDNARCDELARAEIGKIHNRASKTNPLRRVSTMDYGQDTGAAGTRQETGDSSKGTDTMFIQQRLTL
jgi:ribonuclease HI